MQRAYGVAVLSPPSHINTRAYHFVTNYLELRSILGIQLMCRITSSLSKIRSIFCFPSSVWLSGFAAFKSVSLAWCNPFSNSWQRCMACFPRPLRCLTSWMLNGCSMSPQFKRLNNVGILYNTIFTTMFSLESNDLVTGKRADIILALVHGFWIGENDCIFYEQRKNQTTDIKL